MTTELDAMLRRLHMPTVRRLWSELRVRAEQEGMGYADYLSTLMAEEIAHRGQTRVQRMTRRAKFPFLRTIEEFDFSWQSGLRKELLGSYLGPEFVSEGRNLIAYGPSGTGKSHVAVAIAYRAIQNGSDARFVTAAHLLDELSSASRDGQLREALTEYTHPGVLVVDEVGYLSLGPDAANVLFQVVNDRYLHRRPVVFTTNKPTEDWGRVLHDADLAEAILDRVLERGRVLHFKGPSYRTRHLQEKGGSVISRKMGEEFREPTPASSEAVRNLSLLTFSRNDIGGVVQNLALLRPILSEAVVVDSSEPGVRDRLRAQLEGPAERICPAPPVGNVDLLRPYGLSQATQDRVLLLDADESPSPELVREIPRLESSEAYIVPRWETGARGFTFHLRLFSRKSVTYRGPSHAFPDVRGVTTVLPRRYHLVHRTPPGREYWKEGDRQRRYLLSDALERPYDTAYLQHLLGLHRRQVDRFAPGGRSQGARALNPAAVRLALALEALRTILLTGSVGLARLGLEQGKLRLASWDQSTAARRQWIWETSAQVRKTGGLVRFLGFDDEQYVAQLARILDPRLDGPLVLEFLIVVRARTGHPWDGRIPPPVDLARLPLSELKGG